MQEKIRWLVEEVAQNIVGLDVALFFQAHPNVFDSAAGIAMRMGRQPEEVGEALERLASHGILEVYELGAGRYRCYALKRVEEVWNLLCRLSEMYLDDPPARREIIRMLVARVTAKGKRKDPDAAASEEVRE
ncbi:MAG: hypothetical protein AB7W28_04235 [Armatimonadota bacterium]